MISSNGFLDTRGILKVDMSQVIIINVYSPYSIREKRLFWMKLKKLRDDFGADFGAL